MCGQSVINQELGVTFRAGHCHVNWPRSSAELFEITLRLRLSA